MLSVVADELLFLLKNLTDQLLMLLVNFLQVLGIELAIDAFTINLFSKKDPFTAVKVKFHMVGVCGFKLGLLGFWLHSWHVVVFLDMIVPRVELIFHWLLQANL